MHKLKYQQRSPCGETEMVFLLFTSLKTKALFMITFHHFMAGGMQHRLLPNNQSILIYKKLGGQAQTQP